MDSLQYDEGAGCGCQLDGTGNLFAAQAGQLIAFAQNQITTVQSHDGGTQTVLTSQSVLHASLGQLYRGGIGQGVVDDQIET